MYGPLPKFKIEYDPERREQFICFDIDLRNFPLDDCALIIGDAVQNLRSALDLMWYRVMRLCKGTPSRHTKFPIFDAEHDLINAVNQALEKQQIISDVHKLGMRGIRPHKAGNFTLSALNELSIRDKHETLIPVMKIMGFFDVALEYEEHRAVSRGNWMNLAELNSLIHPEIPTLESQSRKESQLKNKRPHVGVPAFEARAVFPARRGFPKKLSARLMPSKCSSVPWTPDFSEVNNLENACRRLRRRKR